jgi:sulfur-carrier protein
MTTVRVALPAHLRNLAKIQSVADEIPIELAGNDVSVASILDALEARYPMLQGTIRDHGTLKRRPFIRFFACGQDLSHDPPEAPLPDAVRSGMEPLLVVGAVAGGL